MSEAVATRSTLKPPPKARAALPYRARFARGQLEYLQDGRPAGAGWWATYREPWLVVHRAEGDCAFAVRFESEGDDMYNAAQAWVTRDPAAAAADWFPTIGGTSLLGNAAFLHVLLFAVLLPGQPVPRKWRDALEQARQSAQLVREMVRAAGGDPLREAEVYMQHGWDDQAREVLHAALLEGDRRPELRERLKTLRERSTPDSTDVPAPATRRSDMKPPPQARAALPMQARCDADQFARLKRGRYGDDADDPWSLVYEEPWLYLYRATGDCVFGLRFEREDEETYAAVEAWASRDPEVTGSDWLRNAGGLSLEGNVAFLHIYFMTLLGAPVPQEWRDILAREQEPYPTQARDGAVYAVTDSPDLDPLEEAEVYIAYGRDAQAQEILEEAIAKGDRRPAVEGKLMEVRRRRGLDAPVAAAAAIAPKAAGFTAWLLTGGAIAAGLWVMFNPRPYGLAIAVLAAVPWIALWLAWKFPGRFLLDPPHRLAGGDISALLIMPSLALMMRAAIDVQAASSTPFEVASVVGMAAIVALAAWIQPSIRKSAASLAFYALFMLPYTGSALALANQILDRSEPRVQWVKVVAKERSRLTLRLRVEEGGRVVGYSVGRELHRAVATGDLICALRYPGAFGVEWRSALGRPDCEALGRPG